jgi:hypothetical protein
MAESEYMSRQGKLLSSQEEVYNFVTDIRNFEQFIPKGTVTNLHTTKESCSFDVTMLGTVTLHISEKVMFNKVVFSGNALHVNDFSLIVNISKAGDLQSDANVKLVADMNPFLKMVADKPIFNFLEMLISGMENFRDWKNVKQ